MRVAVVGTGWGARVQVPAFRHASINVTALWARTDAKAQDVARELGIPFGTMGENGRASRAGGLGRGLVVRSRIPIPARLFSFMLTSIVGGGVCAATSDIQALVARSDVDVVVITTPPGTHRDFLVAAVAADKHIVCEKPTALSEAEAWAMHDAVVAAPTPCLCVIDHELRFLPTVQRMRALLRSSYCGKLFYLRLTINSPRMLPNRVRAPPRPIPAPRPVAPRPAHTPVGGIRGAQGYSWWSERAEGGGVLGAVGTHLIDLVAFLTGERATGVHCRLSTHVPERTVDGSGSSSGACVVSGP